MENVHDAIIIVKWIKIHIPPQKHSIITQYLNILTANIRSQYLETLVVSL